jgi:hypothetical protein
VGVGQAGRISLRQLDLVQRLLDLGLAASTLSPLAVTCPSSFVGV